MDIVSRAKPDPRSFVALETTLLLHGVPRDAAEPLARELSEIVRTHGVGPALVGVVAGRPIVGLNDDELATLLSAASVPKANTSNLGVLMHRKSHAATTVSATMELACAAGISVFATGGIGGVHHGIAHRLDISADLAALARFPIAVVTSGTKSLLDVPSTREALETLGVPVVGFRTDRFPAFYIRESAAGVDARFDTVADLAAFVMGELARTNRAIVIANPVPESDAIAQYEFDAWLDDAQSRAPDASGRDVTPAILSALHEASGGRTLKANLSLVRANTALAAQLCRAMLGH